MIQQNWHDISYLRTGSPRQRSAYNVMRELQLLEELKDFNPILVGTIPIGVDVPQSDLDIACYTPNQDLFETHLNQKFGQRESFTIKRKKIRGQESTIAQFRYRQFRIEVFGQNRPTEDQDAYKHLTVEHRILQLSNEHTRLKIKRLRSSGKKTEPAFAEVLQLTGDAYLSLLQLATEDDHTLLNRLKRAGLV